MSKFARIENGVAIEVFSPPDGFTLADCLHEEVAALFSACPDNVTAGSTVDAKGKWTLAAAPVLPVAPTLPLPLLTPMTLYMAFTPAERVAIKASKDPMVTEFWAMYQLSVQLDKPTDPNLVSVQEAIAYLAQKPTDTPPGPGIILPARISQILAGIPQ